MASNLLPMASNLIGMAQPTSDGLQPKSYLGIGVSVRCTLVRGCASKIRLRIARVSNDLSEDQAPWHHL